MRNLEELIQERIDGIKASDVGASIETSSLEQNHLNQGSPERAYWHHGYASALADVIGMLHGSGGLPN